MKLSHQEKQRITEWLIDLQILVNNYKKYARLSPEYREKLNAQRRVRRAKRRFFI